MPRYSMRAIIRRFSRPGILLLTTGLISVVNCEQVDITLVEPARIELSPATATVTVSQTTRLTATLRSPGGGTVIGHEIEWSSLNPTVASVDNTGMVRGVSIGNARIRAAAGAVSDTATVSVIDGSEPAIALAATSVSFTAPRSGANPDSQVVAVTNAATGTLSGLSAASAYTSGQPTGWLAASLSGTTAPATLRLRATTGTLAVGTYNATVSVSSQVAQNSPQQVEVTFRVQEATPTPPTNFVATAISATQIDLSWSAPTSGTAAGYRIARRTGSNQFAVIDSVPGSTLVYQNTGLAAGTAYDYQISACNAGGCSAFSATASATTPPTAPANLSASGGLLFITLSWTASSGSGLEYIIERKQAQQPDSAYEEIGRTSSTSHQDGLNLAPIIQYTYRVRACTANNVCSAFSNTASAGLL